MRKVRLKALWQNFRLPLKIYGYPPLNQQSGRATHFGDNGTKMAIGKGTINLSINNKNTISISNVYFVPGLAKNLLSISEATSNGTVLEFHNNHAIFHHKLPSGEVTRITFPKMG